MSRAARGVKGAATYNRREALEMIGREVQIMSDRVKGACLTMGGAACWGVSGCMGQYLFTREGMDSTWLVPIRLFLAGLILCAFFFRQKPQNAV